MMLRKPSLEEDRFLKLSFIIHFIFYFDVFFRLIYHQIGLDRQFFFFSLGAVVHFFGFIERV